MKIKILFPDTLHFHKRNFKSLMELTERKDIETIFNAEFNELKSLYGNYKLQKSLIIKHYDKLKDLTIEDLYNKKYRGANIFEISRAELLSFLMPKKNWLTVSISSDSKEIFKKAYKENKDDLLLNMAIVIFWLDYWSRRLSFKNYKDVTTCIIFSGSLIYVKSLSYLLQNTKIKVFVVEHFFTGNDFYFEEKYTHIANNSDIKFKNIYSKLNQDFLEQDINTIEQDIIKAINKLKLGNNKNVKQPQEICVEQIKFDNDKQTVLVIGQVINDFSILETMLPNINSLQIYKNIIDGVLRNTNYNIIFKAHPWEVQKVNIKESLTKNNLISYIENNYNNDMVQKRFKLVEDYNIEELFKYSNIIVGLCSQSLLEASFMGYKTHQIGKAFFGNKNFTFDYNNEYEFLLNIQNSESVNMILSIEEYKDLMNFFAISLEKHLVSIHPSGVNKIYQRLTTNTHKISIVTKNKESSLNISVPIKKDSINTKHILDISYGKSLRKHIIEGVVLAISSDKKIKKFSSNPRKFFDDSSYYIVKLIGKLY